MSQRTIYTCDNCDNESTDRTKFLTIRLTREKVSSDYLSNTIYLGMNDPVIAGGLFCEKCIQQHFRMMLNPPRAIETDLNETVTERSLLQRAVTFFVGKGLPK